MDAYKKAFDPLTVPGDMLDRILSQADAPAQPAVSPKRRSYPALALAACLTLVICGSLALRPQIVQPQPTAPVQVVNPIQTAEDSTELAKTLPFPLKVPTQLPEGYVLEQATSIAGTLAQVLYLNGGEKLTYRMAEGSQDISGDFNRYSETSTVDGVTLKGGDDGFSLAIWDDGTYSYSLSSTVPLTTDTMLAIREHVEVP